jgi:DNA-binding beta-propeller fold protein YncE
VIVRREGGDFARVDLATGSINGPITRKSSYSELRVGPGGTLLCLCVEESGSIGGQPTDDIVSLDRFDARGKLTSSTPIEELSGEADPRDTSIFVPERPPHVITSIGFSDDGRYGFVGWSLRAHPVWHSGVIVVDLASGSIVSRLALPDATDGEGDTRRVVDAPRIVATIDTGTVLIARFFYEWTPPASPQPSFTFENHVFTATLDGGTLGDARLVPTASDCGGLVLRAGALPDGGYWLACAGSPELTVVRRLSPENSLIGDIHVPGSPGADTDPTAVSADGRSLYLWNPSEGALTRVDLASGDTTTGNGIAAAADRGPLAAFGDWLAPTAAAKSWLRGAIAISPDGSRVYAIGIKNAINEEDLAGSAGVFVFDATTLDPITIWQPTADFVSIAVSPDGRFVYAAGLPGFDFTGTPRIRQQASITVFDATDGTVRLIAGQLGGDTLTFLGPTLD